MKTIKEIKSRIEELMPTAFRDKAKQETIKNLRSLCMLLETNPSEESLRRQYEKADNLKREVEAKINEVTERQWPSKQHEAQKIRRIKEAGNYKNLVIQLENLEYLLS